MNDFMTFTKGERVAIIILAAVIFFIIAANFFIANRPSDVNENLHNLDSILALHEKCLQVIETQSRRVAETQSRKVAETQSRRVAETQSRRVAKSVSKLNSKKTSAKSPPAIVYINYADTTELKSLPGIGSFFAKNIVEYRNKLGGFIEISQMLEIYAFDSARLETIIPYISIDSVNLSKINVNTDDFKTILRHPYIEYEDVKKIVNYRESKGMIKDWNDYQNVIKRDNVDKRLNWYLDF